MNLKIYIRKKQLFNFAGTPVIYQGSNPATIKAVPGTLQNNDWVDVTAFVANYEKFTLTWSIQHNSSGEIETGSLQIQKGVSNTLQFEGDAFSYIRTWLVDNVAASLNVIEVKILDTDCGYYEGYMIKSDQISWCQDGLCVYDITLKQEDPLLYCIRSTPISDNWQGWFQARPANGKKHPRFSYCVEMRPNTLLVMGWFNLGALGGITYILALVLTPIINTVIAIINVIKTIGSIFGGNKADWKFFDPSSILDAFKQMFVEGAGCGREHPAPLISDYIKNVCDKCGITVNSDTAPIWYADNLTMTTSSSNGQPETFKNPYKYACYLDAPQKRGVRRFNGIHLFSSSQSSDEFYIPENAPLLTLDQYLNSLKDLTNSDWRIVNKTLYYNRKDQFLNDNYIYDFTKGSPDTNKLVNGVCFEPFTVTMGAYCRGLYTVDAIDTSGNEGGQSNGLISFADVNLNPNFSDQPIDKTTQFSACRFRLDGGTTDYIMDAMQVIVNGQLIQPWLVGQMRDVSAEIDKYANYALLMAAETTFLPKIIIWDGQDYKNARATGSHNYSAPNQVQKVAIKTSTSLSNGDSIPEINYNYPLEYNFNNGTSTFKQFFEVHNPNTFVLGSEFLFGNGAEPGLYRVKNNYNPNSNGGVVAQGVARLVNYPMYFAPQWKGGMWDRFHFIDDPRRNPKLGWNWNLKIELCCEDLNKLKLLGDGRSVVLADKVKLPLPFYETGRIKEITASYDSTNRYGKYIEIKGEC